MNDRRSHCNARTATVVLALAAACLAPSVATAQVLLEATSARFGWQPASGDVEFYEVWVSRSTRAGGYQLEQTVGGNETSTIIQATVGETVRVRVRAGNDKSFGPLSPASDSVRFGLPPELPLVGSPGVVVGRIGGNDTGSVFFADSETGATWRYATGDSDAAPTQIGQEPDDRWTLVASGDFDGDGGEDLFWVHENGATRIWYVDGSTYQEEPTLPLPGPEFHVEVSGDFDGNGQDDLFWRDARGPTLVWLRGGVEFTTYYFPPMPEPTWELLSAGDFDGDGDDDVFWRNVSSTETSIWFSAGDLTTGLYALSRSSQPRALVWEVAETRDEDGDGRDDLRWHRVDRLDMIEWWHMDAETVRAD